MLNLYCIYDRVAGTYGEIFLAQKDALASRKYRYLLQNAPMVASDCDLYKLGTYDPESGCVFGLEKPEFVERFTENE